MTDDCSVRVRTVAANIGASVAEVLEKMMFMDVQAGDPQESSGYAGFSDIQARISFTGEYAGSILLDCTEHFGMEATQSMLGLGPDECTPESVRDTVREILNMVAGDLFYRIDSKTNVAHLGIPELLEQAEEGVPAGRPVTLFPFVFRTMEMEDDEAETVTFAVRIED